MTSHPPVALIPSHFTLTALADFQYLPSRMVTHTDAGYVCAVLSSPGASPLGPRAGGGVNVLPPRFCRWEEPRPYGYHAGTRQGRRWEAGVKRAYFDLGGGEPVPAEAIRVPGDVDEVALAQLTRLFATRPVWVFGRLRFLLQVCLRVCV